MRWPLLAAMPIGSPAAAAIIASIAQQCQRQLQAGGMLGHMRVGAMGLQLIQMSAFPSPFKIIDQSRPIDVGVDRIGPRHGARDNITFESTILVLGFRVGRSDIWPK